MNVLRRQFPAILRPHTVARRVSRPAATQIAVISDLEADYSGISERLMDPSSGKLHRFVNIYVNDSFAFSGSSPTAIADGDSGHHPPAAGG